MSSICVHPDYRRMKVGDQLLAIAEEHCRSQGMRYMRAGARHRNRASHKLFLSRGYKQYGISLPGEDVRFYLPMGEEDTA